MTYQKTGKGHCSGTRAENVPVSVPVPADRLEELAARVLRLTVSRRDPEQFFVERSDIAGEMRGLARRLR